MAVVHLFLGGDKLFQFPATWTATVYPWELIYCPQHASKQGSGCQCLAFSTQTQALMQATARWGCRNTVRESAPKADWEKDPLPYGRLEPASAVHQIRCTAHWATSSRSLVTELRSEWKDFLSATFHMHPVPHHNTHHSQTLFTVCTVILQLPTMPPFWCSFPADPVNQKCKLEPVKLEKQVGASKTWNASWSQ